MRDLERDVLEIFAEAQRYADHHHPRDQDWRVSPCVFTYRDGRVCGRSTFQTMCKTHAVLTAKRRRRARDRVPRAWLPCAYRSCGVMSLHAVCATHVHLAQRRE